jgi:hypothetical protein
LFKASHPDFALFQDGVKLRMRGPENGPLSSCPTIRKLSVQKGTFMMGDMKRSTMYEEESKSNLNMAIKSQNHVVDGCTTEMLCPPA